MVKTNIGLCILFIFFASAIYTLNLHNHPFAFLEQSRSFKRFSNTTKTYSEKVISSGFDFEEHKILTKDGYILTAWRIPNKRNSNTTQGRPPVILQHGVIDDSWTWFALKAEDCLPIMLAKQGYDVWLTNSRGNLFSYEHIDPSYDSTSIFSKFWNFTFHEMAQYDLPANIEYVKNHTTYEKVHFIGHSQGTFQFFLNYLLDPSFINKSIDKFVAIGTVVTIFNIVSKK
jgi:lysosomal acid lipase/cholesteryl ester hydrolase